MGDALRARLATAPGNGAIAIVVVDGDERRIDRLLTDLVGGEGLKTGSISLRSLAGVDDGLVVRLAPDRAWLMPHGGRRIVERIREALITAGASWTTSSAIAPIERYPEAADDFEAQALAAIAEAASAAAIPLLLDQPRRWRDRAAMASHAPPFTRDDHDRWSRLDRLLVPPRVCVVGPPNAGKSTLANALAGHDVAITSPLAGTTRDPVATRIDLAGLVVEWLDLPGHLDHDGSESSSIDRAAAAAAEELARRADLLIRLAAPGQEWIAADGGSVAGSLRVMSKVDLERTAESPLAIEADHSISAATGEGMAEFVALVRDRLVPPEDLAHPGPWRWRRVSEEPRTQSVR